MNKINLKNRLKDTIFQNMKEFIDSNSLKKPIFIVGLSGGPDSICLTYILNEISKELDFSLIAAHFDHQWRSESKNDVKFCEEFCQKREITLISGSAEEYLPKIKKSRSLEETGRLLRIAFFRSTMDKLQANTIILAHHVGDQIENFFIRMIRGASLSGLSGIKKFNKPFLRPMLECEKSSIMEFLLENRLDFLVDPTNSSHDFLRNRIRQSVIPVLESVDSRFSKKALECINHLSEENEILENIVQSKILVDKTGRQIVCIENFKALEKPLQFRLLIKLFACAQAPFKPSQKLLLEAIRFLTYQGKNGSKQHRLGANFLLEKSKIHFYVKSDDQ